MLIPLAFLATALVLQEGRKSEPGMATVMTRGDSIVRISATGRDANGAPITRDTRMRVASVSKSFTAAAVLTLVDEGKLDLDRPIARYLPDFRMADPRASAITVRHLLNQTSGLSDRTIDITTTKQVANLSSFVATLATARLAAAPGSHWEYCNVNYELAAAIVEVVDGRPFAEAMQRRVFGPLGMSNSSIAAQEGTPDPTLANGYNSVFGVWIARAELPAFRGGAGGVVTTASDMGRWLISQNGRGPQILSAGSLRTMHTPGVSARNYGMGWGVEEESGRTLLVHSGNLFTYTAVQAIDTTSGEGWAVLANSATLVDPTYDELLALVRDTTPPRSQRPLIEAVLGLTTVAAIGLGVSGVVRARRKRRAWRLLPPLIPVVLFATYPQWTSFLMNGRTVTWEQMTYFPAPLTIALAATALAGLATFVARLRAGSDSTGGSLTPGATLT